MKKSISKGKYLRVSKDPRAVLVTHGRGGEYYGISKLTATKTARAAQLYHSSHLSNTDRDPEDVESVDNYRKVIVGNFMYFYVPSVGFFRRPVNTLQRWSLKL